MSAVFTCLEHLSPWLLETCHSLDIYEQSSCDMLSVEKILIINMMMFIKQ